jgi:hypothetical protein
MYDEYDHTWLIVFQKRVVCTKVDIYVFNEIGEYKFAGKI